MKLKPLNASTDTALFTWSQLTQLFDRAEQHLRFEFRTVTGAKSLPDVFSELQVCTIIVYLSATDLSLPPSLSPPLSLTHTHTHPHSHVVFP